MHHSVRRIALLARWHGTRGRQTSVLLKVKLDSLLAVRRSNWMTSDLHTESRIMWPVYVTSSWFNTRHADQHTNSEPYSRMPKQWLGLVQFVQLYLLLLMREQQVSATPSRPTIGAKNFKLWFESTKPILYSTYIKGTACQKLTESNYLICDV